MQLEGREKCEGERPNWLNSLTPHLFLLNASDRNCGTGVCCDVNCSLEAPKRCSRKSTVAVFKYGLRRSSVTLFILLQW